MDRDLLLAYKDHLQTCGLAEVDAYHSEAKFLFSWFSAKNIPLGQMTADMVMEYLRFRLARGIRRIQAVNILCFVRKFLRFAKARGMIDEDPTEGLSCHWLNVPGGFRAYAGPIRKILRAPHAVAKHHFSLFAPHVDDYVGTLLKNGYTRNSIYHLLSDLSRFQAFLSERKVAKLLDITPDLLADFIRDRKLVLERQMGHPPSRDYIQTTASHIDKFLTYVFSRSGRSFMKLATQPDSPVLPHSLIARYLVFCSSHKGLKKTTLQTHRELLLSLRTFLKRQKITRIEDLVLPVVDLFTLHLSKTLGAAALSGRVSILRVFFRFLSIERILPEDFGEHLISPCRFSSDRRPKYLVWRKIQELLDQVDRNHSTGKRDYAILILLAHYGLRAREVANLHVADFNFENSFFLLRGRKSGSSERVPLTIPVKKAIQDYLAVRPQYPYPELFLRVQAPIKPLGSRAVAFVAQAHIHRRFGRLPFRAGAYSLRHSFAKLLLDRGARLPDIGTLLGHKRLNTTLIYTRIATKDLHEVAANYADLL